MNDFREQLKSLTTDELWRLDRALAALEMCGAPGASVERVLDEILAPQDDEADAASYAKSIGLPFEPTSFSPRRSIERRRLAVQIEHDLDLIPEAAQLLASTHEPTCAVRVPCPNNVIPLDDLRFTTKLYGGSPAPYLLEKEL